MRNKYMADISAQIAERKTRKSELQKADRQQHHYNMKATSLMERDRDEQLIQHTRDINEKSDKMYEYFVKPSIVTLTK